MAASVVGTDARYAAEELMEIPLARTIYSRIFMSPDWIDLGNGISRWNAPSVVRGVAGGVGSSFAQEPLSNIVKKMQGNKK
jgi:filamentous hemagglutinin